MAARRMIVMRGRFRIALATLIAIAGFPVIARGDVAELSDRAATLSAEVRDQGSNYRSLYQNAAEEPSDDDSDELPPPKSLVKKHHSRGGGQAHSPKAKAPAAN